MPFSLLSRFGLDVVALHFALGITLRPKLAPLVLVAHTLRSLVHTRMEWPLLAKKKSEASLTKTKIGLLIQMDN